jgi:hypothetical protein
MAANYAGTPLQGDCSRRYRSCQTLINAATCHGSNHGFARYSNQDWHTESGKRFETIKQLKIVVD